MAFRCFPFVGHVSSIPYRCVTSGTQRICGANGALDVIATGKGV